MMDYDQYKRFEKAKQIEDIINDIHEGMFDELLQSRYKKETDFENRVEIIGVLSRMCNQLVDDIN